MKWELFYFIETYRVHNAVSSDQDIHKGRGRIRPQNGSLTFLKIFLLEMMYSGRSQHSESLGLISIFLIIREWSMLTNNISSNFSSTFRPSKQLGLSDYFIGVELKSPFRSSNNFEYLFSNILRKTKCHILIFSGQKIMSNIRLAGLCWLSFIFTYLLNFDLINWSSVTGNNIFGISMKNWIALYMVHSKSSRTNFTIKQRKALLPLYFVYM